MIYACILAGGIGSRMGSEKPKQYINIGGKPIILHTAEKFCMCSEFRQILILCPEDWMEYTEGLIRKHIGEDSRIRILPGGETRNDTIQNAITYIESIGELDEDTVVVTHDAVFVNLCKIISHDTASFLFILLLSISVSTLSVKTFFRFDHSSDIT